MTLVAEHNVTRLAYLRDAGKIRVALINEFGRDARLPSLERIEHLIAVRPPSKNGWVRSISPSRAEQHARMRRGFTAPCATCGKDVYRKPSELSKSGLYYCNSLCWAKRGPTDAD